MLPKNICIYFITKKCQFWRYKALLLNCTRDNIVVDWLVLQVRFIIVKIGRSLPTVSFRKLEKVSLFFLKCSGKERVKLITKCTAISTSGNHKLHSRNRGTQFKRASTVKIYIEIISNIQHSHLFWIVWHIYTFRQETKLLCWKRLCKNIS